MNISDLITYGVPTLAALVAGAAAGAFTAWRLRRPDPVELVKVEPPKDRDPFVDAEIDIAAIEFAEAHDLPPQAAGVIAARLRNLHDIGTQKGWI